MTTATLERLAVSTDADVVRVRQAVRTFAQQARLSLVDQTKFVTAASELARNMLVYGGGGDVEVEVVSDGRRTGVRAAFADEGPGIPDLDLALTDGWTSGGGLGLGLSGSRRLVGQFSIDTAPGAGTRVEIATWSR
ncbi:serine/threonine-protein kinase RsbT [Sediminihabitans luteus]|uniref:Serine/threonine-protein kinase RsbT n=1 Tax=Sediminihabitans luteus TaxID=1138585 RepID=A0A2M9CF17_9CELL|nr:ATP-binding protein [Sediminihabitans luteus]PJJ70450.1 serine/threonine-protein kinase RsbT [Sediminihabitans luteus]GII97923.1 anti-sigma regulatory factor [Sediminihabitans luteus]